jgi:hypothetical protein
VSNIVPTPPPGLLTASRACVSSIARFWYLDTLYSAQFFSKSSRPCTDIPLTSQSQQLLSHHLVLRLSPKWLVGLLPARLPHFDLYLDNLPLSGRQWPPRRPGLHHVTFPAPTNSTSIHRMGTTSRMLRVTLISCLWALMSARSLDPRALGLQESMAMWKRRLKFASLN